MRPSPLSGGFNQQAYRPRGPAGPPQWGPRGPHMTQPTPYDYQRPYPSHNPQYPHSAYGGYPQQMGSRSGFNSGWEQRPHSNMQGMPHGGGYDYYGGQGGHLSDAPLAAQHSAPIPSHAPGPAPNLSMGPPPSQANYNYGQPQGDYGHPVPYSQSAHPQQSYGHGYDEPKYDNHATTQHAYGGHGGSQQTYPQSSMQQGYGPQQQYGKPPSYGIPSQAPPPQSYGPPRASQPGDVYQGSIPAQSYGQNVPSQQSYLYASGGPTQQAYPPYGSAPASEGYNQAPPASGAGYPQQGGQPAANFSQPGSQQAPGYAQVGPAGYGQYPSSQPGYPEQSAQNNTAGYGYQGPQDPGYGGGAASAYGAPPTAQTGYTQPTPTQQTYDQSVPQSGAYGGVQTSASVGYAKTVSPQPGYTQYDSAQMYAAPR